MTLLEVKNVMQIPTSNSSKCCPFAEGRSAVKCLDSLTKKEQTIWSIKTYANHIKLWVDNRTHFCTFYGLLLLRGKILYCS